MSKAPIDRLTLNVALAGVVLTVLTGAIGGIGPAVGAVVAIVDCVGLRWLVMRLIDGPQAGRMATVVMLGLKMTLVLSVIWILLARADVHPIGFAVGFSALFIGFALGGTSMLLATEES